MKIVTVNTRYIGGGGAAQIANTLHRYMNDEYEKSSFFLYGRGECNDFNAKKIIYDNAEYVSALSYRLFSREININKDYEDYIKNCDIVHLHNVHGYYLDYIKLFEIINKYNKKVIWTMHDMWAITGRCAYSFGCEKWKQSCGKCKHKNVYPKSLIDISKAELINKKNVIGSVKAENLTIVTPSNWLANICRESYLSKFKIINIPNGIEHDKIDSNKESIREKYGVPINKKVVLFVAADTNDTRKGINYILDIIPECREYCFISVGKKIDNVNFSNFIQFGYISDRNSMNELYYLSDVFVITSIDENFPTTVLESFANSTPVIGFNVGGIPEQVINDTGIIVDSISSSDLKKSLIDILEDDAKLKIYSENARKRFDSQYTIKKFFSRYEKLYLQTINDISFKGEVHE